MAWGCFVLFFDTEACLLEKRVGSHDWELCKLAEKCLAETLISAFWAKRRTSVVRKEI